MVRISYSAAGTDLTIQQQLIQIKKFLICIWKNSEKYKLIGSLLFIKRNNEKENLSLVSKLWFSGDEGFGYISKIDHERFFFSNKAKQIV